MRNVIDGGSAQGCVPAQLALAHLRLRGDGFGERLSARAGARGQSSIRTKALSAMV